MVRHKQTGFTIVELMIATAIFSMILLLCTFGLLQIGRTYYRGVTTSRTQDTTRRVVDMLSQAIQYGATVPSPRANGVIVANGPSPADNYICFGEKRFTYNFNVPVGGGMHALLLDTPSSCTDPALVNPQELLGENMRLSRFSLVKTVRGYEIQVKISHGDSDDLVLPSDYGDESFGSCRIQARSEYCASSELTVSVQRRVTD